MKLAVVFIIILGGLVIAAGQAQVPLDAQSAVQPKPKEQVSIAVTTVAVRESSNTRSDALLLWNRNQRSLPIGHAIKACIKAGGGGIFGRGVMSCTISLYFPLGKVVASGVVHNINRYTLVITGGTGEYEGVSGPLFVRRVGDGVRRLTFAV